MFHYSKDSLGDGRQFGLMLSYASQPRPEGLAQAFLIGQGLHRRGLLRANSGDNVFYGHGLPELLHTAAGRTIGATIFAYEVSDPGRYGIVTFNKESRAVSIQRSLNDPNRIGP